MEFFTSASDNYSLKGLIHIYLFKDFNVVGLKSGVFHFEKLQFCVSHNNLKLKKKATKF